MKAINWQEILNLLTFAAFSSGFGHDVFVQQFDSPFEAGEFHHSVGNLPHPQGDEGFEEGVHPFVLHHLGDGFPHGVGESGGRLDFHFDRLHRAEGDVGDEFGGSRGGEVERRSPHVGGLFADNARVHDFEILVESELAGALGRVAEERGGPAFAQTADTVLFQGYLESVDYILVLVRIYLEPALDQIQRYDPGMRKPAAEDATKPAEQEVLIAAEFARIPRLDGSGHTRRPGHQTDVAADGLHFLAIGDRERRPEARVFDDFHG